MKRTLLVLGIGWLFTGTALAQNAAPANPYQSLADRLNVDGFGATGLLEISPGYSASRGRRGRRQRLAYGEDWRRLEDRPARP